jgi:isocitrate dehydrogenase kinase/phosphatase
VRLEDLGSIEKSNDHFGNRIRDLPACSILPQPTTLPRVVYSVHQKARVVYYPPSRVSFVVQCKRVPMPDNPDIRT